LLGTLGLPWLWLVWRAWRIGARAGTETSGCHAVLVLGAQLHNDRPTPEFIQRLDRARALYAGGRVERIVVLGGVTRENRLSEATVGRAWLLQHGVSPDRLLIEEASRHTLENLYQARALPDLSTGGRLALVTSRYHLARAQLMAQGLGLQVVPCGAESTMPHRLGYALRLFSEGWFNHWYHVGRGWARLTRNRRSMERIS
ncbi:MAG: YdcF family protein, partial [Gammaproteobacteria bacterium]